MTRSVVPLLIVISSCMRGLGRLVELGVVFPVFVQAVFEDVD